MASPVHTVRNLLKALFEDDEILQDSILLTVATVMSGGLNYTYQIYRGRALGPAEYGIFGAVFAIQYLLHILGRSVRFTSIRFVAEARDDNSAAKAIIRKLLYQSTGLGVITAIGLVLATPLLLSFLHISDPSVIWAVAAYSLFGLAHTASQGMLQGVEAFGRVSIYQVGNALLKLGIAVGLVALGFGAFGALIAIAIAALIIFVATLWWFRKRYGSLKLLQYGTPFDSTVNREQVYRYTPPALFAGFCLTVPTTVDVLIVKHFFSSSQAGVFTAVTVFGKALVFFPLGITQALFPKVSHGEATNSGDLNHLFNQALIYTGVVTAAGVLTYWTLPVFILELLFGAAYTNGAALLRWYGLAMGAFVLAVVPLNYELARNRMRYVYLFTAFTIIEIVLMWVFHQSMLQIAFVILGTNVVLLTIGVAVAKRDAGVA